jgi:hypothetical protein
MRPGSARGQERARRAALTFNAGQGMPYPASACAVWARLSYVGLVMLMLLASASPHALGLTGLG